MQANTNVTNNLPAMDAAEIAYYAMLAAAERAENAFLASLDFTDEELTDEGQQDTESADYFAAQSERIAARRCR